MRSAYIWDGVLSGPGPPVKQHVIERWQPVRVRSFAPAIFGKCDSYAGADQKSLAAEIDADYMTGEEIMANKSIHFGRFGKAK